MLGDLRGLKEGFMVVFVASERQKMEKFELAVLRINYCTCAPSSGGGSLRGGPERELVLKPLWQGDWSRYARLA